MQEKQSKWKLRKAAKQLLCLVLCFAMLFTLAPQSYASEAEATTQSVEAASESSEETKTENKEVSEEVTTESKKETAEKKTEATEKTTETKPATTEEKTEATTEETTEAKKAAEEATTEATKEEKTEATTEANATKKAAKAPAKSAAADEADTEEDATESDTATNDADTEDTSYISEFYVTTNKEAISNKDDTVQFYAHVYVNDATTETTDAEYTGITWKIADAAGLDPVSDYLSIDDNGKLTLKKELSTSEEKTITVRATSKYDPDTSEDIEITIKPTQVRSIKISIDDSNYNKNGYAIVGNTVQLTATVSPDNAVEKKITSWTSSDTSVATVDANGKVTAVKQGKVKITAETKNGTKATQELTVYSGKPQTVKIPVWVTNKNKNTTASITLPADGTAVDVSELQSTVTSGEGTYLYTGVVRYRTSESKEWATMQRFPQVTELRYQNGGVQYKTSSGNWTSVTSRNNVISSLAAFYEQGYAAKDADTQAKVSVGDWPGTFEECGNDDNKSIQVLVVNDETGKTEFTSETMLYHKTKGDNNDGWIGKIKLNCDESVYEITTVDIACSYNDNSTNPSTIKTGVSYKTNVSANLYRINSDGVSVKFTGTSQNYEEHYIITAHVKAKTYNVVYDGNGTTTNVPDGITPKMTEKSFDVDKKVPVLEGSIFDGWSYGDSVYHANDTVDASSVKAGDTVTLTARWISKSDMVHYKAQTGGTVSSSYQRITNKTTAIKGSTAKAKDGYIFDGWYEGDTKVSDDIKYTPEKDAAKGKTYTAHFKKVTIDEPQDVVYNGQDHKWEPTVKTEDGEITLVEGTDYKVSYYTENVKTTDFKDVKTIKVTITGIGKYNVNWEKTYKITPAEVTIKTKSASKVYDGDALTAAGSITGIVEGETYTFKVTGTQTDVGSSDNTYSLTWGTAKESNYTVKKDIGKLTVTETTDEIVVTTTGGEFTYDGKAHGATVKVTGLPKGYTVQTATSSATATDVTKEAVAATADNLVIVNKKGEDVTSKLKIKKVDGTIKINPATLTVTTPDKSKVYDGTALTADGSVSGFVSGETATFTTTGTQTDVGSSSNIYSLTWDGTAKQSNYKVSETLGTLTVTKQSITPNPDKPDDPSYKGITIDDPKDSYYDGTANQWTPVVKDKDGNALKAGTDYTVTYEADGEKTTDFINAKKITVTITGTGNYSGTVTKSYEIKKRTVTLTSASDSKTYDGTALTNKNVTATAFDADAGVGFVTGESAIYNVTGSQTYVGTSDNTFSYALTEKTKASNYAIEQKFGELSVTDKDVPSDKVIKKTHDADKSYAVGDTVVFTITVKNIYDAKKTITITEQEGVTITGDSVFKDVAPGAEVKTTAEYKVTEADIVKGSFKNTAIATFDGDGTTPSTPSYSGEDTVDEFTKNAHITVSKVITNEPEDGESYKTGETITYKITVKNDGDITVTGVTVKDALTGDSWQIEKLAVGESKDFSATYKVTEKDAKAGEVTNVATAEAKDGTGDEVTVVDGKVTTKTSEADDTTEDTTEEEETTEETTEKKTTTKSTKKTAAKTTKKSAAAKTGDESKILYYMTAMLVAGAYIFFMLFDRRKEEE